MTQNITSSDEYDTLTSFLHTAEVLGGEAAYQAALDAGQTELTYRQWVQVRTPEFKQWFGDWENDPANASKVINERTGEPLVVYHGTRSGGFHTFDVGGSGKTAGTGAFFSETAQTAKTYSGTWDEVIPVDDSEWAEYGDEPDTPGNYEVFLNIRQPDEYDFYGNNWNARDAQEEFFIEDENGEILEYFTNEADAEFYIAQQEDEGITGLSIQKELNTDFSDSTDSLAAASRRAGADGVRFLSVVDEGRYGGSDHEDNVWVAFDPAQIKSANHNLGYFSGRSNDIRFRRSHPATEHSQQPDLSSFEKVAESLGGEAAYQAARDAGQTELDYRQWVQVRTPEFKAWFGDWENDPANASKVINERTGEPLVVYHGTQAEFEEFSREHIGKNGIALGKGFYFTDNYQYAESYSGSGIEPMPVFLNIRSNISSHARVWNDDVLSQIVDKVEQAARPQYNLFYYYEGRRRNTAIKGILKELKNMRSDADFLYALSNRVGGNTDLVNQAALEVVGEDVGTPTGDHKVFVASNATQIKSATANNGLFNPFDPNIKMSHNRQDHATAPTETDHINRIQAAVVRAVGEERARHIHVVHSQDARLDARFSQSLSGVEGWYDGRAQTITLVADHLTEETAALTAWHELGHRGMGDAAFQQYRSILAEADQNDVVRRLTDAVMRSRHGTDDPAQHRRETAVEEALAELFAARKTGNYAHINQKYADYGFTGIPTGMHDTLSGWLMRTAQKLTNWAAKVLGVHRTQVSDTAVFAMLGKIDRALDNSLRQNRQAEPSSFAQTAEALGGETAYQAARDAGQTELNYRQWVQVRTPEFKQWFGDWENDPANASKVINKRTGEPLVVYHGTETAGFTQFETDGWNTGVTTGSFFSEALEIAQTYSGTEQSAQPEKQEAGNYAVFLNIRQPETYDFNGSYWNEYESDDERFIVDQNGEVERYFPKAADAEAWLSEQGEAASESNWRITANRPENWHEDTNSLAHMARLDNRFDGVCFKNVVDEGRYGDAWSDAVNWVVFRPEQIKSADFNDGRFHPQDADIRFSRKAPQVPETPSYLQQNTEPTLSMDEDCDIDR